MGRSAPRTGHCSQNHDSDEDAAEDKHDADSIELGHDLIAEADTEGAEPGYDIAGHKHMPGLRNEGGVFHGIHLNCDIPYKGVVRTVDKK